MGEAPEPTAGYLESRRILAHAQNSNIADRRRVPERAFSAILSLTRRKVLLDSGNLILDKFKGSLLGCAVGDAMGAPIEGLSAARIRNDYGTVTGYLDTGYGAGRLTDDTQMTIVLAQAIIEIGFFWKNHVALKFASWMERSDEGIREASGVCQACASACRSISMGVDPDRSGVSSACCGAAMRASPIGLRYFAQHEELKQKAVEQASITHTDSKALAGSAAVAYTVARGIASENVPEPRSLLQDVASFVSDIDLETASKIEKLADYVGLPSEEGFRYTGTDSPAIETVPAALLSFLQTPEDPLGVLVTSVNAGGKTGSIASISGAMCGAFNGAARIPSGLLAGLEGKRYIELLAFRLYTLTPAADKKWGLRP